MGKIGSFGKTLIFEVSEKKMFSFGEFKQDISARWKQHETILKKPQSEFLGPELRTISMEIYIRADMGIKPRKTLEKIEKMVESGTVEKLVIGGKAVGKYKWKITKATESWNTILSKGELMEATVSIDLEEYL